jgi:hypothetical protein
MCLPNRHIKDIKGDEATVNRNRRLRRHLHRSEHLLGESVHASQKGLEMVKEL